MIVALTQTGGAERFVTGIALTLPSERFESWVCAPRGGDPVPLQQLAQAGVPFVDLGRRSKLDVHRLAKLAWLIRRERFDVVHTHLFGSNFWGSLIARACRVPVVIAHEHTWSYEGNRLRVWLDGRVIGRLVSRFIAVSAADAERMVRIERIRREKVTLIPSAYVPHAPDEGNDVRAELGIAADVPVIGTACSMRPQKALEVLLEAHARVRDVLPTAQLLLAGDGECRPALEERAAELGLGTSAHFLGDRADIDAFMRALDVAAMSSDYEGVPLFAFECMATGTPLVATDVGGLPDIIEDGVNGMLVPRRDPERLAEAIIGLIRDPSRASALAATGYERLPPYQIGAVTERIGGLYEELADQAGRRRRARTRRQRPMRPRGTQA